MAPLPSRAPPLPLLVRVRQRQRQQGQQQRSSLHPQPQARQRLPSCDAVLPLPHPPLHQQLPLLLPGTASAAALASSLPRPHAGDPQWLWRKLLLLPPLPPLLILLPLLPFVLLLPQPLLL